MLNPNPNVFRDPRGIVLELSLVYYWNLPTMLMGEALWLVLHSDRVISFSFLIGRYCLAGGGLPQNFDGTS